MQNLLEKMVKKIYNLNFPSGKIINLEVEVLTSTESLTIRKVGEAPLFTETLGRLHMLTTDEAKLCERIPVLNDDPEVQLTKAANGIEGDLFQVKFFKTEPKPDAYLLCNGYYIESGLPDSSTLYYDKCFSHVMCFPLYILMLLFIFFGIVLFFLLFMILFFVAVMIYKLWYVPKYDVNKVSYFDVNVSQYLRGPDVPVVAVDMSSFTTPVSPVVITTEPQNDIYNV